MKKISVITPCHNSTKYLQECLNSLENQSIGIENLELIIVDDASTDDTWKQIKEFEERYPQSVTAIRLHYNKRQGGARNEALKYVTGEYTAFLDSDDQALPKAYEILYRVAKETQSDIVQFNHYNCDGKKKELENYCKLEGTLDLEDVETRKLFLITEICSLCHCTKIYRSEIIKDSRVQFAEYCIYEEPLFVYPLFFYAKRVTCVNTAFYKIRIHAESTMHRDAKDGRRLLDHPQVQLCLLQKMKEYKGWMRDYYFEIEFYFLKTYYLETLFIAGQARLQLPLDYFIEMQQNIQRMFPDWRSNVYLQNEDTKILCSILETAQKQYSQDELNWLCERVYWIYTDMNIA